jgi:hypothetical protein
MRHQGPHRVHPTLPDATQCSRVGSVHYANELADGVAVRTKVLQQGVLQEGGVQQIGATLNASIIAAYSCQTH